MATYLFEEMKWENLQPNTGREFEKGMPVTNPRNWSGRVEKIERGKWTEEFYVWVRWKEREESADKWVAKIPVIGHLPSQIRIKRRVTVNDFPDDW